MGGDLERRGGGVRDDRDMDLKVGENTEMVNQRRGMHADVPDKRWE